MLTVCYLLFVISVLVARKRWSKSPGLERPCSLEAVAFSLLFSVCCGGGAGGSRVVSGVGVVCCCWSPSSAWLDVVY